MFVCFIVTRLSKLHPRGLFLVSRFYFILNCMYSSCPFSLDIESIDHQVKGVMVTCPIQRVSSPTVDRSSLLPSKIMCAQVFLFSSLTSSVYVYQENVVITRCNVWYGDPVLFNALVPFLLWAADFSASSWYPVHPFPHSLADISVYRESIDYQVEDPISSLVDSLFQLHLKPYRPNSSSSFPSITDLNIYQETIDYQMNSMIVSRPVQCLSFPLMTTYFCFILNHINSIHPFFSFPHRAQPIPREHRSSGEMRDCNPTYSMCFLSSWWQPTSTSP